MSIYVPSNTMSTFMKQKVQDIHKDINGNTNKRKFLYITLEQVR